MGNNENELQVEVGEKVFNPLRRLREFLGIPESYTQPYSEGLGPIISGEFGQLDLLSEYISYPKLQKFFNVVKDGKHIVELHVNKEKEDEYLSQKKKLGLPLF